MNRLATQPDLNRAMECVRERCRALSVSTTLCDAGGAPADGGRVDAPCAERVIGAIVNSPLVRSLLRGAAEQWGAQDEAPRATELFTGFWAIPLPEVRRRRRVGYLVGFAIESSALSGEHFEAACQSARLDTEAARDALAALAVYDRSGVARTAMMLYWAHRDRAEIASDETALSGFSRQLTESYEEISFLHKLGRSMNEVTNPRRFAQLVCDELHATLTFRWIAARFFDDERSARGLAGQCVVSGDLPWSYSETQALTERLSCAADTGDARVIDAGTSDEPLLVRRPGQTIVQPLMREGRMFGAILAGEKLGEDTAVSNVDIKLLEAAAQHMSILLENVALYDEQQSMFLGTLGAITASIDAKDRYTCGHSERVAMLAMQLAAAAGLDEASCERVRICGLVHDVGKIGVPEIVLRKPGRLTDEEFDEIRKHPVIGHRILRDIPQLRDVLGGVLHHHERWDGAGYPEGLQGHDIPLFARVIGIADAYDAMRSTRTYRDAIPHEKVLTEIRRCAGMQFDPALTPLFMRIDFSEFNRLIGRHKRRDATGGFAAEAAA